MQPPAVLRAPVLCMRLLQRRSHVVVVALPARVASLTPPFAAPSRSPSPTLPSQQGLGAGVVKQGSLDARYARLCAVDAHSRWLRRWVPDMVRLSAAHMLAQAVPSQNLRTVALPHQASWMLFTGEFIGAHLCVCSLVCVRARFCARCSRACAMIQGSATRHSARRSAKSSTASCGAKMLSYACQRAVRSAERVPSSILRG